MKTTNENYSVPLSIVIAGLIISGAIIMVSGPGSSNVVVDNKVGKDDRKNTLPTQAPKVENMKPVNENDHILGDPNAPIKIMEFSDTECPFCQRFHGTMHQIIDEYGKDGKVAWVYRHFPLDQLHSKARKEAEATECAADLGGNQKFWEYIDRLFEITPANNGLGLSKLPEIAEYVGLNRTDFENCLSSGKYVQEIEEDVQDAVASGGRGTPYSIMIDKDGNKVVINGAQPYSNLKQQIDLMLAGF